MGSKKKRRKSQAYKEIELNIMPFIDVFSVLTTFLLMVAVFVGLGVHEVQVPFFSSAPEDPVKSNTQSMSVEVEIEKDKIEVKSYWTPGNTRSKKQEFKTDENGLKEFHQAMIALKNEDPENDLVNMYIEEDVQFELISQVLDEVKLLYQGEKVTIPEEKRNKIVDARRLRKMERTLFPKVVFTSVIL